MTEVLRDRYEPLEVVGQGCDGRVQTKAAWRQYLGQKPYRSTCR